MKKNQFGVVLLIVATVFLMPLISCKQSETESTKNRNAETIQESNGILLSFTDERFEQKSTIISKDMIAETYMKYDFEDSQFIIFRKTYDDENAHSGVIISETIYDLGKAGTLHQAKECIIATTDIYGVTLVKITGVFGAAYAPSEYYCIDSNEEQKSPRLVLRVENYNNKEVDLDSDGVKEIFECSMFASFLHRYDVNSHKFYMADLLADTGAMQVVMDDNNLFTAYFEQGDIFEVYIYSKGQLLEASE